MPTHPPESPTIASQPIGSKYDRLLSRYDSATLPPLIVAVGLDTDLLEAIDRRSTTAKVLAIEPVASEMSHWQSHPHVRAWLASGRLRVLQGPLYEGHAEAWSLLDRRALNPPMLVSPVLQQQFPVETATAKKVAQQIVLGAQANDNARQRFAGRYLLNTLANLPTIAIEGDVSTLDHVCAGLPAIVIGAGPSLDRNLTALRGLEDRSVLIAVDTAVRPLLAAGIRPTFIVSVDPSDVNARHLRDLPDTKGMWLAAEASLNPRVFPQFTGRTFTLKVSGHQPWPWLEGHGITRGALQTWGSVLTTAFDLARRLGCDPIVFAGADLSYSDGRQYCHNTVYDEDWGHLKTDDDRQADLAAHLATRAHLSSPDLDGHDVITTPDFIQFRDWLVAQATAAHPRRIINATGGGILHGGRIERRDLSSLSLPSRTLDRSDVHARLCDAWAASTSHSIESLHALERALAYGTAIPFDSWFDFGGDTATREQIADTTTGALTRITLERRKRTYLARQRDSYDQRLASLEDAQALSHGHYDIAVRKAASQQAHVLLDFVQRTYHFTAPGLLNVFEATSTLPRTIRALDIGCGIGRLMEPLVSAGIQVDGVDISRRMLHFARQNPALSSCQFFLCNGQDLGAAPDSTYDLVYSQLCFRYIYSRSVRNDILRAIARALRPGGVVVVEMRFFPADTASSIPLPHVPWSADHFDQHVEALGADVRLTPDELPLLLSDFSSYFDDVRLQFVDMPLTSRHRLPPQLIVSGSASGDLASRIHARSDAPIQSVEATR